jgi:hypothetical protein
MHPIFMSFRFLLYYGILMAGELAREHEALQPILLKRPGNMEFTPFIVSRIFGGKSDIAVVGVIPYI